MAIFFIVSPAGTLKKLRVLLMVYFHLLTPSGVAWAAAFAVPHVNGRYNQSEPLMLCVVITPTCTYTLPEKPNKPLLPLVASRVMVIVSLSFGKAGVQVN